MRDSASHVLALFIVLPDILFYVGTGAGACRAWTFAFALVLPAFNGRGKLPPIAFYDGGIFWHWYFVDAKAEWNLG